MRRWILLAILLGVGSWGSWIYVKRYREMSWGDAYGAGISAYSAGNFAQSDAILEPLVAKTENWWPHGEHTFKTVLLLAMSYRVEGKYDRAEPLFRKAQEITSALPVIDSVDLARIQFGLAVIDRDRGQDGEATQLFTDALNVFQKHPESAYGDDATTLLNLGYLANRQGRYKDAEYYLKLAGSKFEAFVGVGTPTKDLANVHWRLGETYQYENRYAEAAEEYQGALKMYEQVEGKKGLEVEHVLQSLAITEQMQGRRVEARELMMRAKKIQEDLPQSTLSGATLSYFGIAAHRLHENAEAESYFQQSISAFEKASRPDDPALATALVNLGNLYRRAGIRHEKGGTVVTKGPGNPIKNTWARTP